ncbi:MAG: mechanosensitive ion channel [Ardenticatenales bacterium]|nr:mechanosensitive ion channel [Ardenticatenales bacterium]
MEIDLGLAWEKAEDLLNGLIRQLPNIGLGLVAFLLFYFASRWVGEGIERLMNRSRRSRHGGKVFGRLACYATILAGILVALMIVLPDFQPSALIGTLGVGSVAIGFAFRDILQNFLAGLLILFTEPFHIGDQTVFRARWWTLSMRNDVVHVQDRVLTAIKEALTSNGMGFPFPSRTIYFHNRTPDSNGSQQHVLEGKSRAS